MGLTFIYNPTDFWELNKQIMRKPYPIPKISTTLQELEGFTYATALDLSMGYYTIRLDPTATEMCHYHISLGQILSSDIAMVFAGSADIFQAEMDNLMATLEYVRA